MRISPCERIGILHSLLVVAKEDAMSAIDEKFVSCKELLRQGDLSGALGLIAWIVREYEEGQKPSCRVSSSIAKIAKELKTHPFASVLGNSVREMLEKP